MGSSLLKFPVLIMQVYLLLSFAMLGFATASIWQAAPYTLLREKRSPQRTRFFTGNNAVDAGAAGAALGVAAQYFANQLFNPCRRGGTGTKIPTIGFLEDRRCKMPVWDSRQDLPGLLWQTMLWEILVGDRSSINYVIKIPMKKDNKFKIE